MFVRQTYSFNELCFLIELLVHWTWFGQFNELYVILNWLVMKCKLQPELAADSMIKNVGSSQYTSIIPYRVIQLTTISFWVPETRPNLPKSTNNKIPSEESEEPSDTIIHFYLYFFFIHRRDLPSANQRQCMSNRARFPEHVERSFLDPEYSFIAVWQILPTRLAKKRSPN